MYKYVKNMFKKYLFIIGIIISSFLFASCNTIKNDNKNTEKLVIFAAASMTETLTEISKNYKENNNHVDIIFNFDSSGTLKTQIEEGVECDIFISASPKQMDQLDINADKSINKNFIDKIDSNTRFNLSLSLTGSIMHFPSNSFFIFPVRLFMKTQGFIVPFNLI